MTEVSRTTLVRRITIIAVHGTTVMVRQVSMTLHAVAVHRNTPPAKVDRITPPPKKSKRRHRALLISAISVLVAAAAGIIIGAFALHHSPQENGYTYAAVSPNGKFMVSANITSPGSDNEKIYIWDMATRRIVATLNEDEIYGIAISPDSKMIAVAHFFRGTSLWDVATGRVIATLNDPNSSNAGCLAFSPDSKTLAICDGDGYPEMYIWDIPRHSLTTIRLPHEHFPSYPAYAAFAPDGKTLAVSMGINDPNYNPSFSADQPGVEFWNIQNLHLTGSLPASETNFDQVTYSRDGRTLITGSKFWNLTVNPVPCQNPAHCLTWCFTLGAHAHSPRLPVYGTGVRLAGAAGGQ
jgi:hypothetical protein